LCIASRQQQQSKSNQDGITNNLFHSGITANGAIYCGEVFFHNDCILNYYLYFCIVKSNKCEEN
jgi:hypothetical protein